MNWIITLLLSVGISTFLTGQVQLETQLVSSFSSQFAEAEPEALSPDLSIVYVIDHTGSVRRNDFSGMKKAIKKTIDFFQGPHTKFGLQTFSGKRNHNLALGTSPFRMKWRVQRLRSRWGDAPVYEKTLRACRMLQDEKGRKLIILVSDGTASDYK